MGRIRGGAKRVIVGESSGGFFSSIECMTVTGMAAVVRDALRRVAPTVSLYVNDFNTPARRAYARTGFRQVGTFATVLF